MKPDVIILGAGAAGLAAAKALSDAGRSALVLEARDRIGGRIFTRRDAKLKIPIELGAEFIHGRPEVTWKLLREAGLLAFDLPFEHRQRKNGRLVKLPVDEALNEVMSGLAHLGRRDMSFADYLRKHPHGSREARKFAINFVQGFDAADPERISAKSIAEEQEGIGDTSDETQFRVVDGYAALIDHLHRSLDRKRVTIRLRAAVSEIRWQKSSVEVRIGEGRTSSIVRAPRLIVTLPLGVLQVPPETAGGVRFVPEIRKQRAAAMQLASGPIVKVVLRFRAPFWEDLHVARLARADESLRDAVFLHAPDSPFPTWWTLRPLRVPILTGWAGGPKAMKLAGLSQSQLTAAAVDSLAVLFRMSSRRLKTLLEHVEHHDWLSDPFARGAYSYVTVDGMSARKQLGRPIQNTLFFAGEATDTTGQASTVAGALASGQRAAREILRTR